MSGTAGSDNTMKRAPSTDKTSTTQTTTSSARTKPVDNISTSMRDMNISTDSGKDKAKSTVSGNHEKVTIHANGETYIVDRVIGKGSFGVVIRATVAQSSRPAKPKKTTPKSPSTKPTVPEPQTLPGEVVAIKKVLQDKRFKNRELQIMRLLNHPNIVQLKNSFYTNGDKDEVYLHLVLEYLPETVYRIVKQYSKLKQTIPIFYVKLYMYQLCRSLEYIHSMGICHRDIKPQNLLLNPKTGVLALCDFGSAKILVEGEPNVSYICSRYYRAPELIFGATNYTTQVDIWSTGCVAAELLLGQPLFPGESGVDQLVEIIKVLGTPSLDQIKAMNPNYTQFKFPHIKPHPWNKVFRSRTPPEAIDFVAALLQYDPQARLTPKQCLDHPFFNELKTPALKLPNGRALPPLGFA